MFNTISRIRFVEISKYVSFFFPLHEYILIQTFTKRAFGLYLQFIHKVCSTKLHKCLEKSNESLKG